MAKRHALLCWLNSVQTYSQTHPRKITSKISSSKNHYLLSPMMMKSRLKFCCTKHIFWAFFNLICDLRASGDSDYAVQAMWSQFCFDLGFFCHFFTFQNKSPSTSADEENAATPFCCETWLSSDSPPPWGWGGNNRIFSFLGELNIKSHWGSKLTPFHKATDLHWLKFVVQVLENTPKMQKQHLSVTPPPPAYHTLYLRVNLLQL